MEKDKLFEIKKNTGECEKAVMTQIQELENLGQITAAHAGACQLAIIAARNVDEMGMSGRPSGRAQMILAANRALEAIAPMQQQGTTNINELVDAIRADK